MSTPTRRPPVDRLAPPNPRGRFRSRAAVARHCVSVRRLTLTEVASAVHYSRPFVSSVLNGTVRGSEELWQRIATVLEVDASGLHVDGWAL
jgi:Helix-turn-helix domain